MQRRFPHERLVVYELAAGLYPDCSSLVVSVQRKHFSLVDQLLRAASSIALNVAEGAAEFSGGDKARFYRMACRSAGESAAIIDLLRRTAQIDDNAAVNILDRLEQLVAMLTRMSKNAAARR